MRMGRVEEAGALSIRIGQAIERRVCVRLSVSVCLSVTSRSSVETDGRIELGFGVGAFFDLSYTVL